MNEQFHWPLGIAIALLLVEILLPSAPAKKRSPTIQTQKPARPVAIAAIVLVLASLSAVNASPGRAYRDYKAGHFKDARNEYERLLQGKPDDPRLNYNAGAASYRAGAYDAAVKQFNNALKAEDLKLQEMAYYNLGNANFKLGEEEEDPNKKMALWNQAIQNYESSLKLDPKDTDAAFNRDLVKKKLEELKKQQQQQNQDKKDNQDQDKDDQKQDQQKKDNKDQQQSDQKDQNQDSKSDQQKKDEEKQQQEQQQKQTEEEQKKQQEQASQDQKDKPGEEKEDAKQQGDKDQAKNDQPEDQSEAEQAARAAQLGQMTPQQAQQMLDAQKSQEKALIFRQLMNSKPSRNRSIKDW